MGLLPQNKQPLQLPTSSGPYNLKRVRKSPISGCFSWVIEGKRRLGWELPKLYVTIAYGVTALSQINIYGEN